MLEHAMDTLDTTFNRLLRLQAGVASHRQARDLGFRPSQIQHRRRSGDWIPVFPGVVASPGTPLSWESHVVAAQLSLGERAVPSHQTAARLLGLAPQVLAPKIEFTALASRHGFGVGVTMHRAGRLERLDLTTVSRVLPEPIPLCLRDIDVLGSWRCTNATRTLIDLAACCDAAVVAASLDDAVRRGMTTPNVVSGRMRVLGSQGRTGSRLLQELLLDAGGHSWLERRFLRMLREHGLPRPRTQVVFRSRSRTVARVDFCFDTACVIVEVSGRLGHSSESDRRRDARRRNSLQRAGHLVLEFVTVDIVSDPQYVVAELRAALRGERLELRRG